MSPQTKTQTRTQNVGSHLAMIEFGHATVPIGFVASHRKSSHAPCMAEKGFFTQVLQGKKAKVLCECATTRAFRKIRDVGKQVFADLGKEWLDRERLAIKASEDKCKEEGRLAKATWLSSANNSHSQNPYPPNSDQHLAWSEGFGASA